jgi:hypothetical protein
MSSYPYCFLPPYGDNIRLLRPLPNEDEAAPLHCELRNYSLQKLSPRTHLYEALSYVWGDARETLPIYVNNTVINCQSTQSLQRAWMLCRGLVKNQKLQLYATLITSVVRPPHDTAKKRPRRSRPKKIPPIVPDLISRPCNTRFNGTENYFIVFY